MKFRPNLARPLAHARQAPMRSSPARLHDRRVDSRSIVDDLDPKVAAAVGDFDRDRGRVRVMERV